MLFADAFAFDDKVIVQQWIEGVEVFQYAFWDLAGTACSAAC